MSFTCWRDECNWPPPKSVSIHQPLNYHKQGDLVAPTHGRDSGYPPSCTPLTVQKSCFCSAPQKPERSSGAYFSSLASSPSGTLTKTNLSPILKGFYIYKFGERILTRDLGDGEWSRLRHTDTLNGFWQVGELYFSRPPLPHWENDSVGHRPRSKRCQSLQYLGTPKKKHYALYRYATFLNNRLEIIYNKCFLHWNCLYIYILWTNKPKIILSNIFFFGIATCNFK